MTPEQLRTALSERLEAGPAGWLAASEATVRDDAAAVRTLFPQVGRRLGRGPLRDGWTVDDAGRALLLLALGERATDELGDLYRYGDAAERRGVLRALDVLDLAGHERLARDLVADGLRTNDLRLVEAALGEYSVAHLDDDAFAHAVLKCVFSGVSLTAVPGLPRRATPGLARMLASFAHERIAAGRTVPAEIWPLIDAHPPAEELAAITAELSSPIDDRRRAAAAALAERG